jgi:hypothetical protein
MTVVAVGYLNYLLSRLVDYLVVGCCSAAKLDRIGKGVGKRYKKVEDRKGVEKKLKKKEGTKEGEGEKKESRVSDTNQIQIRVIPLKQDVVHRLGQGSPSSNKSDHKQPAGAIMRFVPGAHAPCKRTHRKRHCGLLC